jgi:hypothetical protein
VKAFLGSRAVGRRELIAVLAAVLLFPGVAAAQQTFGGYAALMIDAVPRVNATELRTRVYAEYKRDLSTRFHLVAGGFIDGLVARGREPETIGAAIVRPQEVSLEARWAHADVRAGMSRVVWGRLDEFLPTDVVNPQDLTRFFLEGRAEARMPVGMVRARWLPSDTFALEGIYVPVFRAGRFDQLDEPTSPFNPRPPLPFRREEPARTFANAQGGVRATATTGRVDWSVSAYRGFETLPVYRGLTETFPRFTMIGGDFETVKGLWGFRGEVALKNNSQEGGVGLDRKAGAYRVSGNVLFARRTDPAEDRRDFNLVGSIDRSFARETRSLRAFAVYNPGEGSAFARLIGLMSVRDNVSVEGSAGWFTGDGTDVLARFADRDFVYLRLKVFF